MDNNTNRYSFVAIAVSTYYPTWYKGELQSIQDTDKVRGDLALEFAKIGSEMGLHLVITDGASSLDFQEALSSIQHITVLRRDKLKRSPARRAAIIEASRLSGIKVIIITEPEKTSLLMDCLSFIINPLVKEEADFIISRRDTELTKATYPLFQVASEIEANRAYNALLREKGLLTTSQDLDFYFGSSAFVNNPTIISLYMHKFALKLEDSPIPEEFTDPEEYSDTLLFPIVFGLKEKIKIKSIDVPFRYPPLQRSNEEANKEVFVEKRKMQRIGGLLQLQHLLYFWDNDPRSKLVSID